MSGPAPKDPALRARRNKASTRAELDPSTRVKAPPLRPSMFAPAKVHPQLRRWWRVIWQSPMAPRWLEADIERLYLVALLRNDFYHERKAATAAEIRLQERDLGLTPLDRRRLEWSIAGPSQKPEPRLLDAPVEEEVDPRMVLRAVK